MKKLYLIKPSGIDLIKKRTASDTWPKFLLASVFVEESFLEFKSINKYCVRMSEGFAHRTGLIEHMISLEMLLGII